MAKNWGLQAYVFLKTDLSTPSYQIKNRHTSIYEAGDGQFVPSNAFTAS